VRQQQAAGRHLQLPAAAQKCLGSQQHLHAACTCIFYHCYCTQPSSGTHCHAKKVSCWHCLVAASPVTHSVCRPARLALPPACLPGGHGAAAAARLCQGWGHACAAGRGAQRLARGQLLC
jgi:hypothetical protein